MAEKLIVDLQLFDRFQLEHDGYSPREINNACAYLRAQGEPVTVTRIRDCLDSFRLPYNMPS